MSRAFVPLWLMWLGFWLGLATGALVVGSWWWLA